MSYSTGYHVNSHHLVQKIKKAVLEEGWTIRSTIADGYDYVFYSTGDDGYQDIYIRVAAGQYDYTTVGDVQCPGPSGDGYTGYVNFFAYQYFPQNGGPNDGSNERSRTGPVLYMVQGNVTYPPVEEYDLIASKTTSTRRFVRYTETQNSQANSYTPVTDGHAKFYYDFLANPCRRYNLNTDSVSSITRFPTNPALSTAAYRRDPATDDEFIYALTRNTYTAYLYYHNLTTNEFGKSSSAAPWVGSTYAMYGWMVKGMCRNGNTRLYTARGSATTDWAYYDMDTASWSSLLPAPSRGGWSVSYGYTGAAVFVPKEVTGYTYDRIYSVRGADDTEFQSIAIDDNGDVVDSVWYYHADLPIAATYAFIGYTDRYLFFIPAYKNKNLYTWEFPVTAESSGSWSSISNFFTASGSYVGYPTNAHLHNHLICRVRVSEDDINKHWLSVDGERIAIAVKDKFDKYWYSYAGLFETYSDTAVSILQQDATATDTTIFVDDVSMFKIGENYIIIDITGDPSTHVSYQSLESSENLMGGWNKIFGPSETVTVSGINAGNSSVTISGGLAYDYKSGSKIGKDPQPVMVRAEVLDEAYALNNLNTADSHNSLDAPYQRYKITNSSSFANASDTQERNDTAVVYPATIQQVALNGVTSSELRGQLKEIYFVGNGFSSEDSIVINGKAYVVIKPEDISLRIAIGPLE